MRAGFILNEVRIGVRRNLQMTFAVIITVAISLTLLGFGLLANAQVTSMKDYWYNKIEVSVFLCGSQSYSANCSQGIVTAEQRNSVLADLKAQPIVENVYYESQKEAFKHFQKQFKGSAITENVTQDQLPESFRVKLKDPTQYNVITSEFSGRPGVDSIQDERVILSKFFKLLNMLRNGAVAIGLASVLTAALLISNTLRLAAFNRRKETGVMKLVGASSFSIQLPFVLEAIFAMLIGWFFSFGILCGFKYLVDAKVEKLLRFTNYFSWKDVLVTSLILLGVGFLVSSLASIVTLRRHLKV